jgi:hypothetical protein
MPGCMKVLAALSIGVLGASLGDAKPVSAAEQDPVTAIDILLEPDETMIEKATADNQRLLKAFPEGFALDETHTPHISVLQRYVKTADLDKVYEAVGSVLAGEKPASWELKAYKYFYVVWDDLGLAGISIEPTDDLIRYQHKLIDTVAPFTVQREPRRRSSPARKTPTSTSRRSTTWRIMCRTQVATSSSRTVRSIWRPQTTWTGCSRRSSRRSRSRQPRRRSTISAISGRRRRSSRRGSWRTEATRTAACAIAGIGRSVHGETPPFAAGAEANGPFPAAQPASTPSATARQVSRRRYSRPVENRSIERRSPGRPLHRSGRSVRSETGT